MADPVITPPVPATLAVWLKAVALYTTSTDADRVARWGDRAIDTEVLSCIALKAGADAEAVRQLQLLGGPLVRDDHVVRGLRHNLIGRRIRIRTHPAVVHDLGYADIPVPAFVIRAEESSTTDTTLLSVLRRLA